MPHYHILINRFISAQWLSAVIEKCGFGPIFKIKDVDNHHIFTYVIKYLRKGISDPELQEVMHQTLARRFSFSLHTSLAVLKSGYHAFTLIRATPAGPLNDFIVDMWYRLLDHGGAYPLQSTPTFVEYFMPFSSPLLLAAPTAAPLRPALV
jgi:hypothetical protein